MTDGPGGRQSSCPLLTPGGGYCAPQVLGLEEGSESPERPHTLPPMPPCHALEQPCFTALGTLLLTVRACGSCPSTPGAIPINPGPASPSKHLLSQSRLRPLCQPLTLISAGSGPHGRCSANTWDCGSGRLEALPPWLQVAVFPGSAWRGSWVKGLQREGTYTDEIRWRVSPPSFDPAHAAWVRGSQLGSCHFTQSAALLLPPGLLPSRGEHGRRLFLQGRCSSSAPDGG